jgi:hypothetical protein
MEAHEGTEPSPCHPEGALRLRSGQAARSREPEQCFGPFAALKVTITWSMAALLIASNSVAQVGHPPGSSPYRDIRKGHTITATGGYFSGDGGDFEIGPHGGATFGVRYDIRTASTIQLGLGLSYGTLDRFIVDPFVRLANRRSGPVSQSVAFAEVDIQLNLTGGKSWNRIAPYIGLGGGLAVASDTPADTSLYEFGRKFYLVPHLGFRLFLSERLHLRLEARATFWKLNYPTTFQQEPREEPGTVENPNAVIPGDNLSEWTTSPWLQAGLGYSFSP